MEAAKQAKEPINKGVKHPWACPVCGESASWQCYSAINVRGLDIVKPGGKIKARFQRFPANPPLIGVSLKEIKVLRSKPDQIHFDLCVNCGTVVS